VTLITFLNKKKGAKHAKVVMVTNSKDLLSPYSKLDVKLRLKSITLTKPPYGIKSLLGIWGNIPPRRSILKMIADKITIANIDGGDINCKKYV
jgi:hypothetical protein